MCIRDRSNTARVVSQQRLCGNWRHRFLVSHLSLSLIHISTNNTITTHKIRATASAMIHDIDTFVWNTLNTPPKMCIRDSGKMATCLSQLYHEHKRGIRAGYAKFETFPIWTIPLKHPVNLAYEAATADLNDCLLYTSKTCFLLD